MSTVTRRGGMMAMIGALMATSGGISDHMYTLRPTIKDTVPSPKYERLSSWKAFNPNRRTFGRTKKVNRLHLAKKAKLQRRRSA